MSEKRLLEAALWYAEKLGWPVLPLHSIVDGGCSCGKAECASPGKHPRTKHGLKDSSTDPEVLRRWWTEWPSANVGVRTGAAAGIVVVDIDPRHGGDDSLAALICEHGELPATTEALTGGGGQHLIFQHPGTQVRNRSNIRPGTDVRGDGGYVVAPPSTHVSGQAYRWRAGHGPDEIAPAAVPAWLSTEADGPGAPNAKANGRHEDGRDARALQAMLQISMPDHGDGSKRLFTVACRAGEHGLSDTEALSTIRAYERVRPFPRAYSDTDVLQRVHDAARRVQTPSAVNGRKADGRDSGNGQPDEGASSDDLRPIVLLPGNGIEDREAAARLSELLDATGRFYIRGGLVVRLDRGEDGSPLLILVKAASLPTEFEEVARLLKRVKQKNGGMVEEHALCNESTAKKLLHARVFRDTLPPIRVVSPVPVLIDRGGQLVQICEFDRASGILAQGPPATEIDLAEARKRLHRLVSDFRFLNPSDRSRALAAFIAPALVLGDLLGGRAPLDLGEADDSQAGKGYRAKLVAAVYGRRVATVTQRKGGVGGIEESFSSHLVAGRSFISFDNFRGKLDLQAIESFLTEDTFLARIPYSEPAQIDPQRFILMLTSNRAELTVDMANRASIVRILKQPSEYRFQHYPEGDLLAHVRANCREYLAAVFAVVRAWVVAGRERSPDVGHDFRAWAGALDWIVREVLGEAPLLEGHESAKQRVSTPHLNWLRDVAQVVARAGRLDQPLRAYQLLDLLAGTDIEIPGVDHGADMDDTSQSDKALRGIGRRLSRCFARSDVACVDQIEIRRVTVTDSEGHDVREYVFTEHDRAIGKGIPAIPPPFLTHSRYSRHGTHTFCRRGDQCSGSVDVNKCPDPMAGIAGNTQKRGSYGGKGSGNGAEAKSAAIAPADDWNPGCLGGEQSPDEIRYANATDDGEWEEI